MDKRMLADVLWEAANVHHPLQRAGSCVAVATALGMDWGIRTGLTLHDVAKGHPAFQFLESLGCSTNSWMFPDLADDPDYDIDGGRYMWLLLAMHVAEDEGIAL